MAAAERTPIDGTSYFKGSVGKAQNYYNSTENDYEYVKVKSKSGGVLIHQELGFIIQTNQTHPRLLRLIPEKGQSQQ